MNNFTELNAGESSRASHVWRVDLPTGPVIYRRSWWTSPDVSAFMLGLSKLFCVDPRNLQTTAATYRFWHDLDVWAVPQPLGLVDFQGGEALSVEFIEGETIADINGADARELGRRVARLHGHSRPVYGNVLGQQVLPLGGFYAHALAVCREVIPKFRQNWDAHWDAAEAIFAAAPSPTHAAPMLLDWNGTQFIWRGGQPFALVDIEASALAPVELDLCFWEVLLLPQHGREFRAGYTEIRPFPPLAAHRSACRLILLALESEGSPPLAQWLALPAHFGE